MFVSVIICTYNRASSLKRTLQSFIRQTIPTEEFELLVVDDGSVDNTAEVCRQMQVELPNLKYLSAGTNIGLASAANLGIESSKGDYILFTDDDCLAKEDWIERMQAALELEDIVAGAVESPTSNYIKLCHNISQFHCFMPGRKVEWVDFVAGANVGFKRSVLEELGGFEQDRRCCPDTEFILRARMKGHRIFFADNAIITHDPARTTLASIFQYSSVHACHTIPLRNKYRKLMRTPFVLRSRALVLLAAPVIALKITLGIYLGNLRLIRVIHTAPVLFALKLAWCWGAACGLKELKVAGTK